MPAAAAPNLAREVVGWHPVREVDVHAAHVEPELGELLDTDAVVVGAVVVVVVVVRIERPAETHLDSLPLRIQLPRQEEVVRRRWVVGVPAMRSAGVGDAVEQVRRIVIFIATVPLEELVEEVESRFGRLVELVELDSRTRWLRKENPGTRSPARRLVLAWLLLLLVVFVVRTLFTKSGSSAKSDTQCNSDIANVVQNEERGARATTTQKN